MNQVKEEAKRDAAMQTRNALANGVTLAVRSVQKLIGKELGKSAMLDVSETIATKLHGHLEGKRVA